MLDNIEHISSDMLDNLEQESADTLSNVEQIYADTLENIKHISADALDNTQEISADMLDSIHQKSADTLDNIQQTSACTRVTDNRSQGSCVGDSQEATLGQCTISQLLVITHICHLIMCQHTCGYMIDTILTYTRQTSTLLTDITHVSTICRSTARHCVK